jgi:hypothetical protein
LSTSLSGYCAAKAAGSCASAAVAEIIDITAAARSGFNPDMVILHFLFCVSARWVRLPRTFLHKREVGIAVRKTRRMPIKNSRTPETARQRDTSNRRLIGHSVVGKILR